MRFLRILASILLLVVSGEGIGLARPARVILLRHAEKPEDPSNPHLSEIGKLRANALAYYLTTNTTILVDGPPAVLIASKFAHSGDSERPFETLEPLAKKLNLKIETPFGRKETADLVRRVVNNPAYDNKTIVICWVQDYLPEIAREFGVKKMPSEWKSSVYDRFWVITWGRKNAKLTVLPQPAMPMDSGR